jgi:hypothetical protein
MLYVLLLVTRQLSKNDSADVMAAPLGGRFCWFFDADFLVVSVATVAQAWNRRRLRQRRNPFHELSVFGPPLERVCT